MQYTQEMIDNALELVDKVGLNEASARLHINPMTVSRWYARAAQDADRGLVRNAPEARTIQATRHARLNADKVQKLRTANQNLQRQVNSLQQRLSTLEKDRENLTEKKDEADSEYLLMKREIASLRKGNEILAGENTALKEKNTRLREALLELI